MTLNSFSPLAVQSPYTTLQQSKKREQLPERSEDTFGIYKKQQTINQYVENNPDYDTLPKQKKEYQNEAFAWEQYNSRL